MISDIPHSTISYHKDPGWSSSIIAGAIERRNFLRNGTLDPFQRVKDLFQDKVFLTQLYHLAAPIALQNLLTASLNMVGSVMVGQLGDAAIASVGLASQVFFLLSLILFGIGSGSAMFTAQLWGNKDIVSLRKVLGLCLAMGLLVGGFFLFLCELFPARIIGIFTTDPQVINMGGGYLQIYAWTFLFFSVTSGYASVLRSIGEVKLPMVVTVSALALNITLNYVLIFGALGFPALGIRGAAVSGVIARGGECTVLVLITYWKKYPIAAKVRELIGYNLVFFVKIFRPVLPVILNELMWSLAVTIYSVVYARIGTPSIAAMNIVSTVDNLALVPFFGLSSAIAIISGHKIGAGEKESAYRDVGRTMGLAVIFALLVSGIVLVIKQPIVSLYKITPDVALYANRALVILALWMVVRSQNMVLVIGMMRSGGDSRYSLLLDGVIIWILGVPMAVLGGFILHLPVYWVYLMVMSEELTKCILGLRRYFSRKWIHDLAQTVTLPSPSLDI
jgi:putative MATE family efflux protein